MRNGVAIAYGDVAPDAKENFVPTASESKFNTLSQLQKSNQNFPNYNNPCELYSVILDGRTELLSENINNQNVGLVSVNLSEQDGTFETPITLTLVSNGTYSSKGLTFTFDIYNEIYATDINIKWYRVYEGVETLLSDKDFAPDEAFYYCENDIEFYNKLVITFSAINMPYNRLRLRVIDYGYGTFFYGDELRSVKLVQQLDPISTEISINTADFILDSKSGNEYNFQEKQPLSVYFNGVLRATTFIKTAKRTARFLWNIQSEDYIGLMDTTVFVGGMYTDKNAIDLLEEIFTVAKVPYEISDDFEDVTVTGYISYTTCRAALMQVAFAIMAVVDTSNYDKVKVFALNTTSEPQTIPLKRIMQGQNYDNGKRISEVDVTAHFYAPISDTIEAYKATIVGTRREEIFVKFAEPLHNLQITNGTIVSRETNYAIIKQGAEVGTVCRLTGQKYDHTTTVLKKRNLILANDIENVVEIQQATLVSYKNNAIAIDNVLENCYNWLIKTRTTNLQIVEGKNVIEYGRIKYGQRKYGAFKYGEEIPPTITYDDVVNVGDTIKAETEYFGDKEVIDDVEHHYVTGIVTKQTYNLNGNIIVKETVMK